MDQKKQPRENELEDETKMCVLHMDRWSESNEWIMKNRNTLQSLAVPQGASLFVCPLQNK